MAKTITPKVRCPKCTGAGTVDLPAPLQEALTTLRALGGRSTPRELHDAIVARFGGDFGVTAICNRLEQLRDLELVTRSAGARGWIYTQQKTNPQKL